MPSARAFVAAQSPGAHLALDQSEILLSLDQVKNKRVSSRENQAQEQSESVLWDERV